MQSGFVKWAIFLMVLAPSTVFAFYFIVKMRLEILKVAASRSPKAFRFVTCGFMDINDFRQAHMDVDSDEEDSSSEQDDQKPNAEKLRGFKFDGAADDSPSQGPTRKKLVDLLGDKTADSLLAMSESNGMVDPRHVKVDLDDNTGIVDPSHVKVSMDANDEDGDGEGSNPSAAHLYFRPSSIFERKRGTVGLGTTQNFEYQHELEFKNENAESGSRLGIKGLNAPDPDSDDSFSDED